MRHHYLIVALVLMLALGAGTAFAQKEEATILMSVKADGSIGGNLDEPSGEPNLEIQIDITGVESFDGLNDPDNTVLKETLEPGCLMTGIGWDVTLETVGLSWLSEAVTYFDGADLDLSGLFLTVGVGDNGPGTMSYSSGGKIDLTDNGIPNIPLPDGQLFIQFFESFVDNPGEPDAVYLDPSTYDICFFCPPPPITDVPTLNTVGLVVMLVLLAGVGTLFLTRRMRHQN